MGFDKHFHEDHCYLDDPTNDVGMNVEIIEDNCRVGVEQSLVRYPNSIFSKQIDMSESLKKVETHVYLPYTGYCTEHTNMFLLEDKKLVKPGDKFASHDDFVQYLNENAKRWHYYYKCSDSRNPNTENETYTYTCVYLRNKEKYKKKGLRKRNNNMKTDCPCKIKIRHQPNEKELTVVYVCNHHDHELSSEEFCKLQHGRRLPPYIKEEILDLLALQVDKGKIKKYVEMETGLSMSRTFFYALEKNLLKANNVAREMSEDRWKMLNEKIAAVEIIMSNSNKDPGQTEEYDEQSTTPGGNKSMRVLKTKHMRKYSQIKRKSKTLDDTLADSPKRTKVCSKVDFNETIQSVENLQESVKCEIQKNPWVSDQCVPVLPNRTDLIKNSHDTQLHTKTDTDTEACSYKIIEYYDPNDDTPNEVLQLTETINNDHVREDVENDIHNTVYETVVTGEHNNETQEYVNEEQAYETVVTGEHNNEMQEYVNEEQAYETVVTDEHNNEMQEYVNEEQAYETVVTDEHNNEIQEYVNDEQAYETVVTDEHNNEIQEYVNDEQAYETVVTDEHNNEIQEYVNEEQAYETVVTGEHNNEIRAYVNEEHITMYSDNSQEVINNSQVVDNTQGSEVDQVEYEDDDVQLVEYINGSNGEVNESDNSGHDIGVQTNTSMEAGHMMLPVFNVYMKDGNVTGFVLNDNIINGLKGGVDKCIQTSEDIMYSDIQEIENEDSEIIQDSTDQTGDTYIKHEYVHKYNIEQYMTQPNFPKYIEILGKETYTDVLSMLTSVYNEKAMFKLTTTQKGNEGNTRIRYVTHNGKVKKKKTDDVKRERLGKRLHSVFVLKEKLRMLKKQNDALWKRNKYLEDVVKRR